MRGMPVIIMASHRQFNKQKNGDDHKVLPIMTHLTCLGYQCIREPYLKYNMFSTRNHIRRPDILVKFGKFQCYLEIDGKVHGIFEQPSKATMSRNKDLNLYCAISGLSYTILSEEDAKFFKLDKEDLAGYLIGLEYTKWLSVNES